MNTRNTQFASFAKLLLKEMMEEEFGQLNVNAFDTGKLANLEEVIARRAYDLAYHVMSETTVGMAAHNESSELARQENIRYIPDLTHWPDEVHDEH